MRIPLAMLSIFILAEGFLPPPAMTQLPVLQLRAPCSIAYRSSSHVHACAEALPPAVGRVKMHKAVGTGSASAPSRSLQSFLSAVVRQLFSRVLPLLAPILAIRPATATEAAAQVVGLPPAIMNAQFATKAAFKTHVQAVRNLCDSAVQVTKEAAQSAGIRTSTYATIAGGWAVSSVQTLSASARQSLGKATQCGAELIAPVRSIDWLALSAKDACVRYGLATTAILGTAVIVQKYQQARKEHLALMAEADALRTQLATDQPKLAQLQRRLAEESAGIALIIADAERERSERMKLEEMSEDQMQTQQAMERERKQLRAEVWRAEQAQAKLKAKIERLKQVAGRSCETLREERKSATSVRDEHQALREQFSLMQVELQIARDDKSAAVDNEALLEEARAQHAELNKRLESELHDRKTLETALATHEQTEKQLKEDYDQLLVRLAESREATIEAQEELSETSHRLEGRFLICMGEEEKKYQAACEKMEAYQSELKIISDAYHEEVSFVNAKVVEMRTLAQEKEELKRKTEDLQKTTEDLMQQCRDQETVAKEKEEKLRQETQMVVERAHEDEQRREEECKHLRSILDSTKRQMQCHVKESESQKEMIESMQEQLEEQEEQFEELDRQVEELKWLVEKMAERLATAEKRVRTQQEEIALSEEQIIQAKREMNATETKYGEAMKELDVERKELLRLRDLLNKTEAEKCKASERVYELAEEKARLLEEAGKQANRFCEEKKLSQEKLASLEKDTALMQKSHVEKIAEMETCIKEARRQAEMQEEEKIVAQLAAKSLQEVLRDTEEAFIELAKKPALGVETDLEALDEQLEALDEQLAALRGGAAAEAKQENVDQDEADSPARSKAAKRVPLGQSWQQQYLLFEGVEDESADPRAHAAAKGSSRSIRFAVRGLKSGVSPARLLLEFPTALRVEASYRTGTNHPLSIGIIFPPHEPPRVRRSQNLGCTLEPLVQAMDPGPNTRRMVWTRQAFRPRMSKSKVISEEETMTS